MMWDFVLNVCIYTHFILYCSVVDKIEEYTEY
jgi:hypothetical protein